MMMITAMEMMNSQTMVVSGLMTMEMVMGIIQMETRATIFPLIEHNGSIMMEMVMEIIRMEISQMPVVSLVGPVQLIDLVARIATMMESVTQIANG
ncbi:MAG: Uncharacterised protein [Methanobacteriota archaeon]|nr:MAG: Uncharacterised protein [Euryarchaeota archaeon]